MSRYARQIALPQVGTQGQDKLRSAHVLVAGAGGLGVPVLQYLVGAGVGTVTLIDGDSVAQTNLHRQPLYRMSDVGRPKVQAAAESMAALNPDVTLHAIADWLTPANAPDLVAGADVILDCADTFAASFTLSDAAQVAGKPLVSASALGMSGYVGGFCASAPSLRAVFPDLPRSAATCETAGVLGPVVAIIGAAQAQMALAVLLDLTPSPLGQMMILDTTHWRMSSFRFDDAPEPESPAPFIDRTQITREDLVIDLRVEAPAPFIASALHLSGAALPDMQLPDTDARIVLACRTGLRAHHAGMALRNRWAGAIALLALPDP